MDKYGKSSWFPLLRFLNPDSDSLFSFIAEDSFTYTEELTPEPAATRVGFSPVVDREDPPPTDDVVVPSRSQTPTSGFFAPSGLESEFHRPFRECMQGPQNKFKQTILQRYLNDTCHPAAPTHVDMEMSAFNKTRSRKPSGSIGSRDYEEMSTASSAAESHFYYDGKKNILFILLAGFFKNFTARLFCALFLSSWLSRYRHISFITLVWTLL